MENLKDNKVKILNDEPTSQDCFAHKKVADAISELIIEENGGRAIALTGTWGSGKSSIIEMIKEKTKEHCKTFVFNTWVHEGDPLRRAFLESLILSFLQDANVIDHYKWENKLELISKRKEKNNIENKYHPTTAGIIFLFSTLFVPVGASIFSKWPNLTYLVFYISLLLLFAPVFCLLISFITYFSRRKTNENWFIDFKSLFVKDSTQTIHSTTFREPEPTTIEFQKCFFDLMKDVCSAYNGKILIVIDNLDRVDANDALRMWSTMRTFFDFSNKKNNSWIDNTWLLVPFDKEGINKLWNNTNKSEQYNCADSFLEKTFQIFFETPAPVLSDINGYFFEQFQRGISNITESEILNVYRIFKSLRKNVSSSPTPREIKLFINTLSSTFRQWHREIPLSIQAAYVLKMEEEGMTDGLFQSALKDTSKEFFNPDIMSFFDNDYREYLAALHFNVEKAKAMQLLIGDSIENAIETSSFEDIKDLYNLPGFWEVLSDKINKTCSFHKTIKPFLILNAALIMDKINIENNQYINNSWAIILWNITGINEWLNIPRKSFEGFIPIIKKIDDTNRIIKIITPIFNSKQLFEYSDGKAITSLDDTLEGLNSIATFLTSRKQEHALSVKEINASPSTYNLILYMILSKNYVGLIDNIKTMHNFKVLFEDISIRISNGTFTDRQWANVFSLLYGKSGSLFYEDILINTTDRISSKEISLDELGALLHVCFVLHTNTNSNQYIDKLLDSGRIHHYLHIAFSEKNFDCCCLCLFFIIGYNRLVKMPTTTGNSREGFSLCKSIVTSTGDEYTPLSNTFASFLVEFKNTSFIFGLQNINNELKSFKNKLISAISEFSDINSILCPDIVYTYEPDIYDALYEKGKYEPFFDHYLGDDVLLNIAMKDEFTPKKASLYFILLNSTVPDITRYHDYLKHGLDRIQESTWNEEINSAYYNIFDLLSDLIKKGIEPMLKTNFFHFVDSSIKALFDQEQINNKFTDNILYFIKALDNDHQNTILVEILSKLINYDDDYAEILDKFPPEIFNSSAISEKKDDIVRVIFRGILNKEREYEFQWMLTLIDYFQLQFKQANPSYLNTIKGEIDTLLGNKELQEELRQILIKMIALL